MKLKLRAIVLLAVFTLIGAILVGCTDRDNPMGAYPSQPKLSPDGYEDLEPPLPGGDPDDSEWVAPPYEPQSEDSDDSDEVIPPYEPQPEQPDDSDEVIPPYEYGDLEAGLPESDPDDSDWATLPDEPQPEQPEQPDEPFAPPIENAPQRPNTQPHRNPDGTVTYRQYDPNARDRFPDRPPPPRNPDGTIG